MDRVIVDLRHCYGINALVHTFDFTARRQNVIYAPNGVMKSSLARTFKDVAEGRASLDRIHKELPTSRSIKDEAGNELSPESIFVVEPYSESYRSNRVSTLLANQSLRERYDAVRQLIDEKKVVLISALKGSSGVKGDIEGTLARDVVSDEKEFFTALRRLKPEADATSVQHFPTLSTPKYSPTR